LENLSENHAGQARKSLGRSLIARKIMQPEPALRQAPAHVQAIAQFSTLFA
jgi:hypothetical protein